VVVYPQGLNTPGQLTDPNGQRTGWQAAAGDAGDRDLRFFDALLARLRQDYRIDSRRIYATGHSNGGGFVYLLWLTRGEVLAAVAPSSAVARYAAQLRPKPVMHLAGTQDPLVKFAWQERMIDVLRTVNRCDARGRRWDAGCTVYPSDLGTPVVTFVHPGGHAFDPAAPPLIVKFFQLHPLADPAPAADPEAAAPAVR